MSGFFVDECLDAVAARETSVGKWAEACNWLGRLGIDGVFHGKVAGRCAVLRCNIEPGWITDLEPRTYAETDPFFTVSCATIRPTLTGPEFLHLYPDLTAEAREFIESASLTGFTAGLAVPTLKRSTAGVAGWHLLSSNGRACIEHVWREHGQSLALWAHAVDHLLDDCGPIDASRLTVREADCLKYLAAGFKTKEIAFRLGIRPVTVDFHFANARKKLGGRSREQTLALALKQNLISL